MEEGEGSCSSQKEEEKYTEIDSTSDSLNNSVIFHLTTSILGFILFMHEQIPSVLQDITLKFDSLKEEYEETKSLSQREVKAAIRRTHMSKMREVRMGIKRFEKLMSSIRGIETALQLLITELPGIESFILVLGASPIRPHQVYELKFSHGNANSNQNDFAKSKAAEALSRKAIRALMTEGAGSGSYPGPTKLFLLVKAPSSFNLPLHFLPKRDFRYSKKIVPVRLRVKCKSQDRQIHDHDFALQKSNSSSFNGCPSNELIWFQCRHVVKGLSIKPPTEE